MLIFIHHQFGYINSNYLPLINPLNVRLIQLKYRRGELTVQNKTNNLGVIIKTARLNKDYTREQLAEKIHISSRYLTSIENENKKPSYDILYKLVRELGIPADTIFFPEMKQNLSEKEQLVRMISQCDEHSLRVLFATTAALLDRKGTCMLL